MFVANLPTWNRLVQVYRVQTSVAGNLLRGEILGQVYCGPKRVNLDFEDYPSLNYFLYPADAELILYPPTIPEDDALPDSRDVIVFPWAGSPFGDGLFYLIVVVTGPRYDAFPNEHCCAVASPIKLEDRLLWFGRGVEVEWDGAVDEDCAACDALALTFTLNQPWLQGYSTALFSWACSPTGLARWFVSYNPAGPLVAAGIRDDTGVVIVQYTDATLWDQTSPITLPLSFELDPDLCEFPADVLVTPL